MLRGVLESTLQGKRPPGHLGLRWDDKVKKDVKKSKASHSEWHGLKGQSQTRRRIIYFKFVEIKSTYLL